MSINKQLLQAKIIDHGLTYGILADEIGVHPGTIGNVMNGKTSPTLFVLIGIIESLNIKPQEFYEIFVPGFQKGMVS